jgi:hypothetical protein
MTSAIQMSSQIKTAHSASSLWDDRPVLRSLGAAGSTGPFFRATIPFHFVQRSRIPHLPCVTPCNYQLEPLSSNIRMESVSCLVSPVPFSPPLCAPLPLWSLSRPRTINSHNLAHYFTRTIHRKIHRINDLPSVPPTRASQKSKNSHIKVTGAPQDHHQHRTGLFLDLPLRVHCRSFAIQSPCPFITLSFEGESSSNKNRAHHVQPNLGRRKYACESEAFSGSAPGIALKNIATAAGQFVGGPSSFLDSERLETYQDQRHQIA